MDDFNSVVFSPQSSSGKPSRPIISPLSGMDSPLTMSKLDSRNDTGPVNVEPWLEICPGIADGDMDLDLPLSLPPWDGVDVNDATLRAMADSLGMPISDEPIFSRDPFSGLASSAGSLESQKAAVMSTLHNSQDPEILPGTSTGSSNSSGYSSHSGGPCECLQHLIFLIHELDTADQQSRAPFEAHNRAQAEGTAQHDTDLPSPSDSLDAALASHKEAIRYGESMLQCLHCTKRPENLTILTIHADLLFTLGERIVNGYLELLPSGLSAGADAERSSKPPGNFGSASASHPRQSKGKTGSPGAGAGAGGSGVSGSNGANGSSNGGASSSKNNNHKGHSNSISTAAGKWTRSRAVVFGDYEVDSPAEWDILVRNLVALQLLSLGRLLAQLKKRAEAIRCMSVFRKTAGVEKKVTDLVGRLGCEWVAGQ
jgi:hypothetical protein